MADQSAESLFVRRLAAAVRAAWWTLLIGVVLVSVQFIVYRSMVHSEAGWDWVSGLMGVEAYDARRIILLFMLILRVMLAAMLFASVFLSLWVRRLRRIGGA